jgi:hypothetical protein
MRLIPTISALLVMVPSVCMSDGFFRCGTSLVSADISVAELLKKCGKPSSKEVSTHDVWKPHGVKADTSTTEIWRYGGGSRAAPMIVTITDGQIYSIEEGK